MLNRLLLRGTTKKDASSPKSADFDVLEKKLQDPCATPMPLPLDFLKRITRDFSPEQILGRGGFGVVYKGLLRNGKVLAVKKLSNVQLDDEQFHKEVTCLMEVKHKNVIQLKGYCGESRYEAIRERERYVLAEVRHRLICFEYLNNGSLDKYISDESSGLEWNIRYKIIKEICCGVHHLHNICNIIHLDLKPENILMDGNMVPKITDFGMSRLFGEQQSRIITKSCGGTFGYMAPEYMNNGLISTKSDIFSLGVIIIELMIGSRNYPWSFEALGHFFEDVVSRWRNILGKTSKYVPLEMYCHQVNACIKIGMECVNPDPSKRPASARAVIDKISDTEAQLVSAAGCFPQRSCKPSPRGTQRRRFCHSDSENGDAGHPRPRERSGAGAAAATATPNRAEPAERNNPAVRERSDGSLLHKRSIATMKMSATASSSSSLMPPASVVVPFKFRRTGKFATTYPRVVGKAANGVVHESDRWSQVEQLILQLCLEDNQDVVYPDIVRLLCADIVMKLCAEVVMDLGADCKLLYGWTASSKGRYCEIDSSSMLVPLPMIRTTRKLGHLECRKYSPSGQLGLGSVTQM